MQHCKGPISYQQKSFCTFYLWRIYLRDQLLFRSTTITLMLSELLRPRARRVSSAAAEALRDGNNAAAAPSSSCIRGEAGGLPSRRHSLAISQAKSFDRTSHSPSLARIKHSSSGSRFVKVMSGSGITIGFRYLSPVWKTNEESVKEVLIAFASHNIVLRIFLLFLTHRRV